MPGLYRDGKTWKIPYDVIKLTDGVIAMEGDKYNR